MESSIELTDAEAQFAELLERAVKGETIVLTKDGHPVLEIAPIKRVKRKPGTGKGAWMAPDFDDPLEDFAEYM